MVWAKRDRHVRSDLSISHSGKIQFEALPLERAEMRRKNLRVAE
jgi:hypothetical protein